MRNSYSIKEREFLLYATGGISALAGFILPVFMFSQNRVVNPYPIDTPFFIRTVYVFAALTSLMLCYPYKKQQVNIRLATIILVVLAQIPWIMLAIVNNTINPAPPARINPSLGFYFILLSVFLLSSSLFYRGYRLVRKTVFTFMLAGVFAVGFMGVFNNLGIVREYFSQSSVFLQAFFEHIRLAFGSTFFAITIGLPLGIAAYKKHGAKPWIMSITGGIQTIPSLALFGFLIPILAWLSYIFPVLRQIGIKGIGPAPAFIALTLYGLLPIVRNTTEGLTTVENSLLEAARGMGLSKKQLFLWVELPVAMPIVLAGIRTSSVQAVGLTTIAALIGAGGLGRFVFMGLGQSAYDLVGLGVFPIVSLAILTDKLWAFILRKTDRSSTND
ncbi:ABC transporter permease [Spirochaetia bacterium 38H-sp]|uniref:ABC transporter permease n=1 Tax=Rarispira pelagica TaxID=3141764 RepID=A0ABU9UA55_9SPIR